MLHIICIRIHTFGFRIQFYIREYVAQQVRSRPGNLNAPPSIFQENSPMSHSDFVMTVSQKWPFSDSISICVLYNIAYIARSRTKWHFKRHLHPGVKRASYLIYYLKYFFSTVHIGCNVFKIAVVTSCPRCPLELNTTIIRSMMINSQGIILEYTEIFFRILVFSLKNLSQKIQIRLFYCLNSNYLFLIKYFYCLKYHSLT